MTDTNTPQEKIRQDLTLEEAIQIDQGSDTSEKRLGVTKDGIATVDFVHFQNGEQHFFTDHEKLESFRSDPVVGEAVERLHQQFDQPDMGLRMGRNVVEHTEHYRKTDRRGSDPTIFCHYNGYPDDNGARLVKHYNTPERVDALLALGDLKSSVKKQSPLPRRPIRQMLHSLGSQSLCGEIWNSAVVKRSKSSVKN